MIIRIKSKRDGYHRCGVAHPKVTTDRPAARFTKAELERLQADPVLTVELLEDDGKDASAVKGKAGSNAKAAAKKPGAEE